jgi:hypothetical protein
MTETAGLTRVSAILTQLVKSAALDRRLAIVGSLPCLATFLKVEVSTRSISEW